MKDSNAVNIFDVPLTIIFRIRRNRHANSLSYYFSAGYLEDGGIIKNSGFNRLSTRLNVDYQAKKWLKVGANVGYTNSETESNPNLRTSLNSTNLMYYTSMIPKQRM